MENKNIALLGAALIVLGVFAPLIHAPIIGGLTAMGTKPTVAWVVLLAAVAAAVSAIQDRPHRVAWIGRGLMAGTLAALLYFLNDKRVASADASNSDNILGSLATEALQMHWGWAALLIGAGALLVASEGATSQYKCPRCKSEVFPGDSECLACDTPIRFVGEKVFLRSRPTPSGQGTPPQP